MKIVSNKKSHFIAYLLCGILLLFAATLVYFWYIQPRQDRHARELTNTGYIDTEPATQDQETTGQDIKKAVLDEKSSNEPDTSLSGQITAVNQTDNQLVVRAIIQTITSNGTCNLTMNGPNGKKYTSSAGVQALPSSTTCKGFNISLDDLAPGKWSIEITYQVENSSVKMSKEVDIT